MKLELFFDYACPFCYRGHSNIKDMVTKYPLLEIVWRPCEAHPRPEVVAIHSDMAIQGMHYIQANQGDLWKYHECIYHSYFEKKEDISDLCILAGYAKECGVDPEAFKQALIGGFYSQEVLDGNRYAWEDQKLEAVPSYKSGDLLIGSHHGILVSKDELDQFISKLSHME